MADIRRLESSRREPSDGDRNSSTDQLLEERRRRPDLAPGRPPVRLLGAGMGRNDVPQEHLVLDAELREHAVDDRRRRLRRTEAGELALRRERDPTYACAAIAGRLAYEDDLRAGLRSEIAAETLLPELGIGVLVERLADLGHGEPVYELQWFHCTTSSSVRRRCVARLVTALQPGSGNGWPILIPATSVKSSGIPSRSRSFWSSSSPTIP